MLFVRPLFFLYRRYSFFLFQVVQYKLQSRIEEKRKKALDVHLNFIVGQTEKYSSWLAESLKDTKPSSSVASSVTSSTADSSPVSSRQDDDTGRSKYCWNILGSKFGDFVSDLKLYIPTYKISYSLMVFYRYHLSHSSTYIKDHNHWKAALIQVFMPFCTLALRHFNQPKGKSLFEIYLII